MRQSTRRTSSYQRGHPEALSLTAQYLSNCRLSCLFALLITHDAISQLKDYYASSGPNPSQSRIVEGSTSPPNDSERVVADLEMLFNEGADVILYVGRSEIRMIDVGSAPRLS